MVTSKLHVAMLPWFAMGHITPHIFLANKFAENGHRVSFFIPNKTQNKLNQFNLHPHLMQFIPLTVPHVDGLPSGSETMSDVPLEVTHLLLHAFDLTQDLVKVALSSLKPDIFVYDFAHWIPKLVRPLGIKTICFTAAASFALFMVVPSKMSFLIDNNEQSTSTDKDQRLELVEPPEIYPGSSSVKTPSYQMKRVMDIFIEHDGRISSLKRLFTAMNEADMICFRGCKEMESPFLDYLKSQYNKPVLPIGPLLPVQQDVLEESWSKWLDGFKNGSVVYCAFGSECIIEKDQFQELLLGLEQTGLPFIVRLRPPVGVKTLQEALPEGFEERVRGRGLVHEGWIQQKLILSHPSVGCFVSHCGLSSMWESLASTCQIVLLPQFSDQFVNTNFMTKGIKVAIDVERREEDGWFTREDVCKAVKLVMDEGSQVGEQVRANHLQWNKLLLSDGFESSYMDNFILKLHDMIQ